MARALPPPRLDFGGHRLSALQVDVHHRDTGSMPGQRTRTFSPKTRPRTGHDADLSIQFAFAHCTSRKAMF